MTRILFCALFLALPVLISTAKNNSDEQKVASMLDDWYKAAATANAEQYFGHFADDAVFLGTDPGERWTLAEFRKLYSKPSWTYVPQERHVSFSADGSTGWFDELLLSPKYGKITWYRCSRQVRRHVENQALQFDLHGSKPGR